MPTEKPTRRDQGEKSDPYAGLWVAKVGGRIVAQAGTPEQARRAARARRNKEEPAIAFMQIPHSLPPLLLTVMERVPADQEIYMVGGAVRDMLLGRAGPDLDLAVPAGAIELARRIANTLRADFVALDAERDIGRLILHEPDGVRHLVDIAAYRGGGGLEEDLRGRDLTINALAYDPRRDTILDPTGGAGDLRGGQIRACTSKAFREDPVRVLRAVRLANVLGFKVEPRTRVLMKDASREIAGVTPERIRDELFRILAGPRPDVVIRSLEVLGILRHALPELPPMKGVEQPSPHAYDVWTHTLAVVQNLESILGGLQVERGAERSQDLMTGLLVESLGRYGHRVRQHLATVLNPDRPYRGLLFFAALYHDAGKPPMLSHSESGRVRFIGHELEGARLAGQRARALRLAGDEVQRIAIIIANHMRFGFMAGHAGKDGGAPTARSIYRFFRAAGPAGIDLVLLGLADLRGKQAHLLSQQVWKAALDVARLLFENYWERPSAAVSPPRLVDGDDLMQALGITPGPIVGRLLEGIREAQAAGEITERSQAIEYARTRLAKNGGG